MKLTFLVDDSEILWGYSLPWYCGVVYRDPVYRAYRCSLIGLNILIRIAVNIRWLLDKWRVDSPAWLRGDELEGLMKLHHKDGYNLGFDDGQREAKVTMRKVEYDRGYKDGYHKCIDDLENSFNRSHIPDEQTDRF